VAIASTLAHRETDKFVESPTRANKTAVEVTSTGKMIPPPEADSITVAYPNATTEVYSYRVGGISGTVIKTVTVIYTNASKGSLASVEVS
jgi:hypothetical protein